MVFSAKGSFIELLVLLIQLGAMGVKARDVLGMADSWSVLAGCLVHKFGEFVIVLGVRGEMGYPPLQIFFEGSSVCFPEVESSSEWDCGWSDSSIDCDVNWTMFCP